MRKLGPVGISAILCSIFLVVAVVGVMASRSDGDDRVTAATQAVPALRPGTSAQGEVLQCPSGGQAQAFFSQVGGEFRIVGRLASVNASQLLVKGPERYVKLNLARDAAVDGTLTGGQIVKVSGNFDDNGDAQAMEVQQACSAPAAVVAVTAAPTPFPFTPQPTPTAVTTAKPQSVHVAAVVAPTPRATRGPEHENARPVRLDDTKPGKDKRDGHDSEND